MTVSLPPVPVRLHADQTRLTQILINLLNNAAKYTEPGGRISLTVAVEGQHATFRVRDSGIGIARDILPYIFEMFAQADDSRNLSQGGLGIGLFLVRRLGYRWHGGTVERHPAKARMRERIFREIAAIRAARIAPTSAQVFFPQSFLKSFLSMWYSAILSDMLRRDKPLISAQRPTCPWVFLRALRR